MRLLFVNHVCFKELFQYRMYRTSIVCVLYSSKKESNDPAKNGMMINKKTIRSTSRIHVYFPTYRIVSLINAFFLGQFPKQKSKVLDHPPACVGQQWPLPPLRKTLCRRPMIAPEVEGTGDTVLSKQKKHRLKNKFR